jgi:hypothetical protein
MTFQEKKTVGMKTYQLVYGIYNWLGECKWHFLKTLGAFAT